MIRTRYEATIVLSIEREDGEPFLALSELIEYLQDAVSLDLDTEECGNAGVQHLEIDWSTLKAVDQNSQ